MLRPTPGNPWGVEQHHWNTGAKENQQLKTSSFRRPSLRSSPSFVWCPSRFGPWTSPFSFNDLPDNVRSSVRLFADDCVLYRNIRSSVDCEILQEDLNSLARWKADWQMKCNVAKCHSMRVSRNLPDKPILFNYTLQNQILEQVQSVKYLGITIADNLDWGQHISEVTAKATKTLGFLRPNMAFAPRQTKVIAYKLWCDK